MYYHSLLSGNSLWSTFTVWCVLIGKNNKHVCVFFLPPMPIILLTLQVCVSTHQAIIWDTSWMSYNLTQFWHSSPGHKSHTLRVQSQETGSPCEMQIASPGCYLRFWPTGYKTRCARDSPPLSSGPIGLLKWLTELRGNILITRLLV